ncbi:hypothetical protein Cgig2_011280 [Carnegiea gigantea]|uniref:Uncharacterized protein n=1 Tax=Carnegiea gigantea TaxID=171969 RepID=A0A9Q1JMY2_9CARY|nr:hypothetical protein Cgig2_011280 [Carnegiea gigantea]
MTNSIQKKFKVSSTQLLYQSCPYQAITLFIVGPFLDGLLTNQNVFAFNYTPEVMVRSGQLLDKYMRAVTYQVLGHLKTCLVLAFGYVLLHDPFSWRNILGILVAVVGMVLYSYYCTLESQQQKVLEASVQLSQWVPTFSVADGEGSTGCTAAGNLATFLGASGALRRPSHQVTLADGAVPPPPPLPLPPPGCPKCGFTGEPERFLRSVPHVAAIMLARKVNEVVEDLSLSKHMQVDRGKQTVVIELGMRASSLASSNAFVPLARDAESLSPSPQGFSGFGLSSYIRFFESF